MKRFGFIGALLLLLGCGPDTVESGQYITAPDGNAKACAANYTRIAPNYCRAINENLDNALLTINNTCQSYTPASLPASAKYVNLNVLESLTTNNAVAQRFLDLVFYHTAACGGASFVSKNIQAREQVLAANQLLMEVAVSVLHVPLVSGSVLYLGQHNGGASTFSQASIIGYYD